MENTKNKKPRKKSIWEHDGLVQKMRTVTTMNRTKIREIAMTYLIDSFTLEESGDFDYVGFAKYVMNNDIEKKASLIK